MTRIERLTSSRDFRRVTSTGRRATSATVAAAVTQGPGDEARIGVSASVKVGGAVQRNRAKRLLREASRGLGWKPGIDVVLSARGGIRGSSFQQVCSDVSRLAARLEASC